MVERNTYMNDDIIMSAQWSAMRRAIANQDFIESGMEVTAGAGVDMDIDIAAGVFYIAGTRYVYAGGTLTINNNVSGNPRWDIIYIDSTGVVQSHDGIPHATDPTLVNLPVGDLYLGSVYVVSGETDIEDTEVYQWEFKSSIFNHNSEHGDGGDDELDLEDLTGKLATDQLAIVEAGTTLRNQNNTEKTTSSTTYVKLKEVKMNEPATEMRIYFEVWNEPGESGYARIYKNGVALGAERVIDQGPSWFGWGQDLGPFVKNDLIQLYVKANANFPGTMKVRNFRFLYDTRIARSVTNQDP